MLHGFRRFWLLACALSVGISAASAATIAGRTGPALDAAGLSGEFGVAYGVGWTQAQLYTNVTISGRFFYSQFGDTNSGSFRAFLTRTIGAGTTVTDSKTIAIPTTATAAAAYTLFSGLTLGPGTYYLTIAPVDARSNLGWETTAAAVELAPGATYLGHGGNTGVDLLAPFLSVNTGGTAGLVFSVTGDLVQNPAPAPSISQNGVVNGASIEPGIAAGSWVAIRGTNLTSTVPRIWTAPELPDGNLPTSLDGVSVTINGKPAYVYYISPTQINALAPAETATGAMNVVVNNNGSASAPASAQMQSFAPAFFRYGVTNYAIATRFPDNTLIANPAAVEQTQGAKGGDIVILWGTGFGPTNPVIPAGVTVNVSNAVQTIPSVTVGGVVATVIGAALTPGSAGLYQIAIEVPRSLPAGNAAVVATSGGTPSPAGVNLFIAQ